MVSVRNINNIKTTIIGVLLFFAVTVKVYSQFQLPVENFQLNTIGASDQNWGVTRAEDGSVYVANTMGLLRFDGLVWNLYQLPNKTVIRSVLALGDKIFTGSYEEFGYWQWDEFGDLKYNSLKTLVEGDQIKDQEIWKIKSIGDEVFFQSFGRLFKLKEQEISVLELPSLLISINVVDNQLYLSSKSNGIFILQDDVVVPVVDDEVLHKSNIISVSKKGANLFITTSLNGCFVYNKEEGLQEFKSEINNRIKEDLLNSFSVLEDGRMVFGTIKNGLYIASNQGSVLFHFNRENSLENNTVLNHSTFDNKTLWIALDNGLSKVFLDQPSYFKDKTGQLGVVYAVTEYQGKLFLGSNTGLYFVQNDMLHFVEGSQGQVWFLKVIDGELICGHNSGTFLVSEKSFERISDFAGGWTLKAFPNRPNEYVIGSYIGLAHLKKVKGRWISTRLITTTMPFRYVEFETPYVIWAAHAYKGLYRFKLNEDGSFDQMINFKNKGLTSEYNVKIVNVNGGIRFKTNSGWMKYDEVLDELVEDDLLNNSIGSNSSILFSETSGTQVGIKNNQGIFIKEHILDTASVSVVNPIIHKKILIGKELLTKVNSKTIINIVDGFSYVNTFEKDLKLQPARIAKIIVNQETVPLDYEVELPYRNNSIEIYFTAPKNEAYQYQYRLHHEDSWKSLATNKLFLENLKERNYNLEYRVVNSNLNYSETSQFNFEVLPPWYATTLGYFIFTLIGLLIVGLIYLYQRRKLKRKEAQIKADFDRKQKLLLEEKEIEAQQKLLELKANALKSELKLKSKRLADSAMELGKKNEAFQNLRNELLHNREYINNEYWLKKVIRQINKEIEDKDQWALFERNFNQVHEEFFKKLAQINNKLTPKDLKLCAYIKMNLSNKEIAPLMNITVRGVETHRFRLKKKLDLKEENIFEFIKTL